MIGFLTSESGSGVFRSQAPVRVCSLPVQKPTTLLLSETTHDRNGAVRRIQCLCKSARNIYPFDPPVPPVSGHRSVFFYAKCKGVVTPAHSPKFSNSFCNTACFVIICCGDPIDTSFSLSSSYFTFLLRK